MWWWIKLREWLRWVLRGTDFTQTELAIHKVSYSLAHAPDHPYAEKYRARAKWLIDCLPAERAELHHDMMARYGHEVRGPRPHVPAWIAAPVVAADPPPLPEPEIPAWATEMGVTREEPKHVE